MSKKAALLMYFFFKYIIVFLDCRPDSCLFKQFSIISELFGRSECLLVKMFNSLCMIFYDMFVTPYKASHLVFFCEKISVANLMKGVVQWSFIKKLLYTLSFNITLSL